MGLPTLNDILAELARPGRDPRQRFEVFRFAEGVSRLEDLSAGMTLPGIVTNITAFGAFVDVGVHQDGLVHVSQMAERFVRDPHQVRAGAPAGAGHGAGGGPGAEAHLPLHAPRRRPPAPGQESASAGQRRSRLSTGCAAVAWREGQQP